MKRINQNIVAAALGCIAFVAVLGWAGDVDFTDQVILSMSQEEYDNVKSHLTKPFNKGTGTVNDELIFFEAINVRPWPYS